MKENLMAEITSAVRAADERFELEGGSTRHWVRDCFVPELEMRKLEIIRNGTKSNEGKNTARKGE